MDKRQGIGKKKAIQNTLARLGLQTSNREVVAALASFGLDVSEALVQQVRIQMQKEAAKIAQQRVRVPARALRIQRPPKMPPRRSTFR
jgi:hypothetical protein